MLLPKRIGESGGQRKVGAKKSDTSGLRQIVAAKQGIVPSFEPECSRFRKNGHSAKTTPAFMQLCMMCELARAVGSWSCRVTAGQKDAVRLIERSPGNGTANATEPHIHGVTGHVAFRSEAVRLFKLELLHNPGLCHIR